MSCARPLLCATTSTPSLPSSNSLYKDRVFGKHNHLPKEGNSIMDMGSKDLHANVPSRHRYFAHEGHFTVVGHVVHD